MKGLVKLLVLVGVGVGVFYFLNANSYGEKVEFGDSEVYYKDPATQAEAQKLGEFLEKNGYFGKDKGNSVQLKKENDTYQVRFAVKEDAWKEAKYKLAFMLMRFQLKTAVFPGEKVEVHLCDDHLKTQHVVGETEKKDAVTQTPAPDAAPAAAPDGDGKPKAADEIQ